MSFTFTEKKVDVLSCDGCIYTSTERHFADEGCPLCRCGKLTKVDTVTVK